MFTLFHLSSYFPQINFHNFLIKPLLLVSFSIFHFPFSISNNATYLKRYIEQAYQSHKKQLIFGLTDGGLNFSKNTKHTEDDKEEEHIEIAQYEYDLINHNIKTLQEKYPYEIARLQKLALLEESIKQYFTWQSNFESEFNSFLQSELEETTESDGTTQDSDVMSPDIRGS
jgi:hypothetical protein